MRLEPVEKKIINNEISLLHPDTDDKSAINKLKVSKTDTIVYTKFKSVYLSAMRIDFRYNGIYFVFYDKFFPYKHLCNMLDLINGEGTEKREVLKNKTGSGTIKAPIIEESDNYFIVGNERHKAYAHSKDQYEKKVVEVNKTVSNFKVNQKTIRINYTSIPMDAGVIALTYFKHVMEYIAEFYPTYKLH